MRPEQGNPGGHPGDVRDIPQNSTDGRPVRDDYAVVSDGGMRRVSYGANYV